jgi:hypothetical protein
MTTTTTDEKPHVFIHPRDRRVLGLRLKDLASDTERELVRSLAEQAETAAVWPVFRAIGATDAQIDATLRLPGHRRSSPDAGGYRKMWHGWYWRSRGETQFFIDGQPCLGGAALVAVVRRVLGIPELAVAGAAVAIVATVKTLPGVSVTDEEYARTCREHQTRAADQCTVCDGCGEIDWVCSHCDGTGDEHVPGLGRRCHQCRGDGGGVHPCEACGGGEIVAVPVDEDSIFQGGNPQ